ncbi:MAG: hypothetical protein BJ554DRAFT_4112 [Olpidium bornovanus]|uniref:SAP domain-containing protein n=1 Tax=Olpidium bornovanus TaxID=278681 RepID=A0A8H7ZMR4_9FUNG|nr:MAG: hypothetical protein BJ554DRAFT_4112 [Olpidium bornovanus]
MFATTGGAPLQIPDVSTLKKMKVTELKDLLTSHGLPVTGKKDELVQRLIENGDTHLKNSFTPGPASVSAASVIPAGSAVPVASHALAAGPDANASPAKTRTSTVVGHDEVVVKPSGFVFRKLSFDDVAGGGPASAAPTPPKPAADATAPQAANAALPEDFEKRKQRAARFGLPLADKDKLAERAQRFGASLAQPKPAASVHAPPDSSAGMFFFFGRSALLYPGDRDLKTATAPAEDSSFRLSFSEAGAAGQCERRRGQGDIRETGIALRFRGFEASFRRFRAPFPIFLIPNFQCLQGVDLEVLKRRQERFGVTPSLTPASSGMALTGTSSIDEEKKRKRAERFGIPVVSFPHAARPPLRTGSDS